MSESPIPAEDAKPSPKYRAATTFITVLCIVQIPLSLIALSMTASIFTNGPAMMCVVANAVTEALYSQGYEYDQINHLAEDENE